MTLDLTKGYWQIPLSPGSKDKTFSTPYGLHQFVAFSFGLCPCHLPASHGLATYLDDVIIHICSWAEHMQQLVGQPKGVCGWTGGYGIWGTTC